MIFKERRKLSPPLKPIYALVALFLAFVTIVHKALRCWKPEWLTGTTRQCVGDAEQCLTSRLPAGQRLLVTCFMASRA